MSEMAPNTNIEPPTEPIPAVDPTAAQEQLTPAELETHALYEALANDDPTDAEVERMRQESANLSVSSTVEKNADGKVSYVKHYYYQQPGEGGERIEMHPAYGERLQSWKPQTYHGDIGQQNGDKIEVVVPSNHIYHTTVAQAREAGTQQNVAINPQQINYAHRVLTDTDTPLRTISGGMRKNKRKVAEEQIEVITPPELMRKIGLGALQAHAVFEALQSNGLISKQATVEAGPYADSGFQVNKDLGKDDGGRKAPKRPTNDSLTKVIDPATLNDPYHAEAGIKRHIVAPAINTGSDYGKRWGSRLGKWSGNYKKDLTNRADSKHQEATTKFTDEQRQFYSNWEDNRLTRVNLIEVPADAPRTIRAKQELETAKIDYKADALDYLAGLRREPEEGDTEPIGTPYAETSVATINEYLNDVLVENTQEDLDKQAGEAQNTYDELLAAGVITETTVERDGEQVTVGQIDAAKLAEYREQYYAERQATDEAARNAEAERTMAEFVRGNAEKDRAAEVQNYLRTHPDGYEVALAFIAKDNRNPMEDGKQRTKFSMHAFSRAYVENMGNVNRLLEDAKLKGREVPTTIYEQLARKAQAEAQDDIIKIMTRLQQEGIVSINPTGIRELDVNAGIDVNAKLQEARQERYELVKEGMAQRDAARQPKPEKLDIPEADKPEDIDPWEDVLTYVAGEYGGSLKDEPLKSVSEEGITRLLLSRQGIVAKREEMENLNAPMPQGKDEVYDQESSRRDAIRNRIYTEESTKVMGQVIALHDRLISEGIITEEISDPDAEGKTTITYPVAVGAADIRRKRDIYIAKRNVAAAHASQEQQQNAPERADGVVEAELVPEEETAEEDDEEQEIEDAEIVAEEAQQEANAAEQPAAVEAARPAPARRERQQAAEKVDPWDVVLDYANYSNGRRTETEPIAISAQSIASRLVARFGVSKEDALAYGNMYFKKLESAGIVKPGKRILPDGREVPVNSAIQTEALEKTLVEIAARKAASDNQ